MPLAQPVYVSDLIVYLLHALDIDYVTLNPGATTRGLHESLVTYGGNQAPEVITCCHEEVAAAMAEGYYLATGKPLATLVHNIVGLQHASKAIYEAALRNTPMLILDGTGPLDAAHRRPWIDWIHTAQVQGQIVRDYVKWDDQPQGAQGGGSRSDRRRPGRRSRAQTRRPGAGHRANRNTASHLWLQKAL
jgi:acetolactate synthase-1/2/3 large subunit